MKINIYLAGPLFSEAERNYNKQLKTILNKKGFNVFLPQEDAFDNSTLRDDNKNMVIFENNIRGIDLSDVIVAILDGGSDVDSGTAWEVGYAYSNKVPIYGIRTDFRTLGTEGRVNLMIEKSLEYLAEDVNELCRELEKWNPI